MASHEEAIPKQHGPLTLWDLTGLAKIQAAAVECQKVAIAESAAQITYGTARRIGTSGFCAARGDADVRDLYLHVTTREGWKRAYPVSELIEKAISGEFAAPYDWS